MISADVVVIGAGAAGLFCAGVAGQLGADVLVVDHAAKVAEKVRISGGGRCNFTNVHTEPRHFLSANPDFCRSALARYTPADFVGLVDRHGIAWHEKHQGQLFCDGSSLQIVDMLLAECDMGGVRRRQPCAVESVARDGTGFQVATGDGPIAAGRVVVATGGLSIPKLGASDFGYRLARQFGHAIVETRPALVPFVVTDPRWRPFAALAGLSLPVLIVAAGRTGEAEFLEDLLFTHRGLSGPAALQASSYWAPGTDVTVDLAPGRDLGAELVAAKASSGRWLDGFLAEALPRRLAEAWLLAWPALAERPIAELRDRDLVAIGESVHRWTVRPSGTEGYRKAEVTAGGVDTRELDSRSGESRLQPGLHFIGEVVDVTGWLGGYNFQWAWASAAACARALVA